MTTKQKPLLNPDITGISKGVVIPSPIAPAVNQENFVAVPHGKATNALALMSGADFEINRITGAATATSKDVKLMIEKLEKLANTLPVSTHKLFSVGTANLIKNNTVIKGQNGKTPTNLRVSIPIIEYYTKCGYDVIEHPTDTPEEAEAEKKRVKNTMDNARKKTRKDLDILLKSSLSWEEKVKGKQQPFLDVNILGAKGITRSGYIMMEFTLSFAEYLLRLPLTQYPLALLGVDERNTNAYKIGLKMAEHSNMDNNIKKGTSQLLKVSTLLAVTSLPDIDAVKKKRSSWEARIKEPFERSLEELYQKGTLLDWKYCYSKGVERTNEEADFTAYEDWADSLVFFSLKEAPDHTSRLEAREKEKAASKGKNDTKKTK